MLLLSHALRPPNIRRRAVHSARMTIPHTFPAEWPVISPGRFAEHISRARAVPSEARIALIGLPDDLGVKLNSGRVGARGGPSAVRAALARYGTTYDLTSSRDLPAIVWDAGDVQPAPGHDEGALIETHNRITAAIAAVLNAGLLPLCIGGGHDLTFPAVRALAQHAETAAGTLLPVGGISIDAHLDVRDTAGSGMAFRSLIERGFVDPRRFAVLGADPFANSREHIEWLRGKGGSIVSMDELRRDPRATLARALNSAAADDSKAPLFASFDLDAIDASSAPGVSAINPAGLAPAEAAAIARALGADTRIRHFDLMELNPAHDEHACTARLAAHLILSFIAGFIGRAG